MEGQAVKVRFTPPQFAGTGFAEKKRREECFGGFPLFPVPGKAGEERAGLFGTGRKGQIG
jgi:hypothetical protein